jgi:polyphosphate kinase
LQRSLIDKVEKVAFAAAKGVASRIILKMNTLTDEKLMEALVHAGQAGVQIDLIIRGACMLPAQRPGVTDNIRVRSIIGRFLEHSRVFYFRSGNDESLYLSSADWMNRNMLRRVELAWPVEDAALRQRVIDECLVAYLHDNLDAWAMDANGHYTRVQPAKPRRSTSSAKQVAKPVKTHGAQAALMALHGNKM